MKIIFDKIFFILFLGIAVQFIVSCAQVGSLGGGAKDNNPPVPLEMNPPNFSANFTGNKIEIKFDEFVVLDKINEQLLISPPIKKMPDFRLKGKSLIIKFKEDLLPNTTYSMFFGDAVKDLTEGNPVHNFTYIFSTGDYVDSLGMKGSVINAFDLKPMKAVAVMLYKNNNDTIPLDSLPLRVQPYYLSKTDKQGKYFLTGLADDYYLVFALNDKNNNYIFDQPTEEIAFLDTLYHPVYIPSVLSADTILADTSLQYADTLATKDTISTNNYGKDSVAATLIKTGKDKPVDLYMFLSKDTVMRVMEVKMIGLNTIRMIFSMPADSVKIKIEEKPDTAFWFAQEWSPGKDTLTWFLREKNIPVDTFDILFSYRGDTLDYAFIPLKPHDKKRNARQRKKEKEEKHYLEFETNMKGNVKPGKTFYIKFDQPVVSVNFDSVLFVMGKDSVYSPEYSFVDSLKRKMIFPYHPEPGTDYSLLLPDSCVIDWNGYFNREKHLVFRSKEMKSYGTFTLNLHPEDTAQYVVQLLDKKEKILKQHVFQKDTTITYEYLDPGKYLVKIIFDKNKNGRWDTGDYFKKTEPENVTYFNKLLNIRANWEIEESWPFSSDDRITSPVVKRKN